MTITSNMVITNYHSYIHNTASLLGRDGEFSIETQNQFRRVSHWESSIIILISNCKLPLSDFSQNVNRRVYIVTFSPEPDSLQTRRVCLAPRRNDANTFSAEWISAATIVRKIKCISQTCSNKSPPRDRNQDFLTSYKHTQTKLCARLLVAFDYRQLLNSLRFLIRDLPHFAIPFLQFISVHTTPQDLEIARRFMVHTLFKSVYPFDDSLLDCITSWLIFILTNKIHVLSYRIFEQKQIFESPKK